MKTQTHMTTLQHQDCPSNTFYIFSCVDLCHMRSQQKFLNIRGIVTFCFGAYISLIIIIFIFQIFIIPSCSYCTALGGFVVAQIVLQVIMLW
jgi:hypothetical protein